MKKLFQAFLFILIVGVILYIFISHLIHLTPKQIEKSFVVSCTGIGRTVEITITDVEILPKKVYVKVCDKVRLVNRGDLYHRVAFGNHDEHLLYPGFSEKNIRTNDKNEFIANALGAYRLHDHFNDELEAELIIQR